MKKTNEQLLAEWSISYMSQIHKTTEELYTWKGETK